MTDDDGFLSRRRAPAGLRGSAAELQIQRVASPRNHSFQGRTVIHRRPLSFASNTHLTSGAVMTITEFSGDDVPTPERRAELER
jgi:hypothetical protein